MQVELALSVAQQNHDGANTGQFPGRQPGGRATIVRVRSGDRHLWQEESRRLRSGSIWAGSQGLNGRPRYFSLPVVQKTSAPGSAVRDAHVKTVPMRCCAGGPACGRTQGPGSAA